MTKIMRRESETVDPIVRRARGLGDWQIITRDGQRLGLLSREEHHAPNGRAYRQSYLTLPSGERFQVHRASTAIFSAAFRVLSPEGTPIDQQEYFAFIEGARLERSER